MKTIKIYNLNLFKKVSTVMVSGWLLVVGFLMLSVNGARAAWRWDAPTLNVSDSNNWIGGQADFHFYYTGTEITYNLGALQFNNLGDNPWITGIDFTGIDVNTIKGYRLIGYGLYPSEYIGNNIFASGSMQMTRQSTQGNTIWPYTGTSSGNYTLSNYGPDTTIAGMSFAAGATTLNTGTFDARQLPIGTLITGDGIAAGTYVRAVTNSGQIIISKPTEAASNGNYTVTGYRSYSKALGNLTYTGDTIVAQDFAYLNNYQGGQISNSGVGKLIFTDPDAMFAIANGSSADFAAFTVNGTLEFKGNATFAAGYGVYLPYGNGGIGQGKARLTTANNTIYLNAATDVAGDFTKIGPDMIRQRSGSIVLHGGDFNLLDGFFYTEYANQNLTASRIQGAVAINIARQSLSSENGSFPFLYLNATEIAPAQSNTVNLLESGAAINLFSGAIGAQGSGTKVVSSQTVGDVNLLSGRNAVGVVTGNQAYTEGFTLTLKSLNRQNGATVSLFGFSSTFGGATTIGQLKVQNDANIVSALVGGTSGENYGAKNIEILPWASGNNNPNQGTGYSGNVTDFVTYVSGSGFRILSDSEYRTTWTGAAGDNVRIDTAAALTGNATINALKLNAGGNIGINGELTITSGAMILTGNPTLNGSGTIFTGDRPLIVQQYNNSLVVDTGVVLKNSVTGTNPGLIVVANTQIKSAGELGGTVLIQGGAQLQISNGNALTEDNGVRVDAASKFLVDTASVRVASLAGTGYVLLNNNTYKLGVGGMSPFYQTGHVTVQSGGMVSPGDVSGPMRASALYFGKNITGVDFLEDSVLNLDLGADGLSDMLAVYTAEGDGNRNASNPTLTLGDGTIIRLNFLDGFSAEIGDTWLLSTGFSGVTLGSVLLQGADGVTDLGRQFALDKIGNNLRLTALDAIPEPSTWALMVTGAALLAILRRRR